MNKNILVIFLFLCITCPMGIMAQVDTRIAVNQSKNNNTFVVVISNENYKHEQQVPFANNDGEVFGVYCQNTLGIPSNHIRHIKDATRNDINHEINWLRNVMNAYNGKAAAIVYYSGHGMPDEATKQSYLLPTDGYSTDVESGISLNSLYDKLGSMNSKFTLVFLDACFSGAERNGNMMASSRGVAIMPKEGMVKGNMVVFSAAQGQETAYPYTSEKHGMFTYYLLKKLQETGGKVTLGELSDYVIDNVRKQSIISNDKSQTPTVIASPSLPDWRNFELAKVKAKRYVNRVATTTPARPATTPAKPVTTPSTRPVTPKPATPKPTPQPSVTTTESEATQALNAQGKRAMRELNYTKAKQCFTQSASKGSAEGYYQLGMLYSNSNYDGYNKDTALAYFLKAAQANHADAMFRAGLCYLGTDNDSARLWFRRAAQHGNREALKYLK